MESKELSKAELPHNSSKTCIKIVASSHWGAGQLCNEQVYPNGPLGMCRCMEINPKVLFESQLIKTFSVNAKWLPSRLGANDLSLDKGS